MRGFSVFSMLAILAIGVFTIGCGGNNTAPNKSEPERAVGNAAPEEKTGNTPAPNPATDTLSKDTLTRAVAATVFITCRYRFSSKSPAEVTSDSDLPAISWGSGFVIDQSGLIITNRHVVETWMPSVARSRAQLPEAIDLLHLHDITVRTQSGASGTRVYAAQLVAVRELPDDLALLRIKPDTVLTALSLDLGHLEMQQPLWALGFPLGGSLEEALKSVKLGKNPYGPDISVRDGRVTSLRRDDQGDIKVVECSCPIEHGCSGGPVVNAQGKVVAVTTYGIGSRTFTALPAARIEHHFGALVANAAKARAGGGPRVLSVGGGGSGPLSFSDFMQAYQASRDGDCIEFAQGEHRLTEALEVTIDRNLTICGKGMDKTKLLTDRQIEFKVAPGFVLVVHSLEIYRTREDLDRAPHSALWIGRGGGKCMLSNVALTNSLKWIEPQWNNSDAGMAAAWIDPASEPEVCQCMVFGARIFGSAGRARLHGLWMPSGNLFVRTPGSIAAGIFALGLGASLESNVSETIIEGCDLTRTNKGISCAVWGDPSSRQPSQFQLQHCLVRHGLVAGIPMQITGCRFDGYRGLEVRAGLEVSDCLFCTTDDCGIAARNGSSTVRSCRFAFNTLLVFGAEAYVPNETDEQRLERRMKNRCTGLLIDEKARVAYSGNHFSSSLGGVAVRLDRDASDDDAGDNACTGEGTYKVRN